jgi:hypothetical protein
VSTVPASATRTLLRFAAFGGIVLALLAVRVVSSSRDELRRAERFFAENDVDAAIVHYRRAARWYAPGSPFHVVALNRLASIGRRAEQQGDIELALTAYRAIRSAIMSARSFYTPETGRLGAANRRIADLMVSLPPPAIDAGKSREQLRKAHLALLEANRAPDTLWTVVLLIGFIGWIGGAFIFTARAVDEENRLIPGAAARWGTVILICLGLFILGMAFA